MNETLQVIWDFIVKAWTTELFGADTVTIGGILLLVFLFVSVIIVERILQRLLIRRFLSKTRLQPSLQYGLSRIFGYTLIAIGFYVAFQAVGFDLSSLAIVAASVGVGVGFGLQNIINNFVSGIIILAERPISIGDRIEVAGVAGRVTKIQLRSTTVVTNDNITMIVPNADFISNTVTNWSHGDPKVRIRVPGRRGIRERLETVAAIVARGGRRNIQRPCVTRHRWCCSTSSGTAHSILSWEFGHRK